MVSACAHSSERDCQMFFFSRLHPVRRNVQAVATGRSVLLGWTLLCWALLTRTLLAETVLEHLLGLVNLS
jgi:hypothetical protein